MKKAIKSHKVILAKPPKKGNSTTPFFQKKDSPASETKATAFFQPKLKVNAPNDKYEKEADRVADQVSTDKPLSNRGVFQQITPLVQRKTSSEKEEIQTKKETVEKEENPIQRKGEEEEGNLQMKEEEGLQLKKEEDIQRKSEEETLQKKSAPEEEAIHLKPEEEEASVQMKEEEEVQAKSSGRTRRTAERSEKIKAKKPGSDFSNKLNARKGQGRELPETIKTKMETTFGADFSNIRIHTDQTAINLAKEINAQAFAIENNIFFNTGKFKPDTQEGLHLLAHELTHTIQQGAVAPKEFDTEKISPADEKLELGSEKISSLPVDTASQATLPEPDFSEAAADLVETQSIPETDAAIDDLAVPVVEKSVEFVPSSPEEDPNFLALKERTSQTAKGQKKHTPASDLSQNASDAAPVASNESTGLAQAGQVEEMDKKETKEFDAASFKKLLLDKIKEILPESEEEADKFSQQNDMDEVKSAASGKVAEEKASASGGIPEATNQAVDPASAPKREVADLKTQKSGAKPKSLEAGKAMPPTRPDSQVNQPLEENAAEVDQAMAENNITEDQLARSEEPAFMAGLAAKKTAQDHSKSAPEAFREQESGTLQNAQQTSDAHSQEQLEAMHGGRAKLVGQAVVKQKETSSGNTSKREQVAKAIDGIYENTKTKVNKVLTDLDDWVSEKFELANEHAKGVFERFIEARMDEYKEKRYGAWFDPRGWGKRLKDTFVGMPDEVNKYFVQGRDHYVGIMDTALGKIAVHVAGELNRAKELIGKGKEEVADYVAKQPGDLRKFAQEKANEIQESFNQLEEDVNNKQEELIDSIAESYKASLEEVDARVEEMKAANRGLIDKAMDAINGIIETIQKLRQVISDLMSAIQSVVPIIMADPLGFVGSLFEGIGIGFENFEKNIKKHLLGGLFKWLSGAMGPMGIEVPEDLFSIKGIFNLIVQVLGLGWDFIRDKLVRAVGEKAVNLLEKGFEIIKVIHQKGIDGIWEFVQEKFQDLKISVLDAIQDMVIVEVIKAGVKWLLNLLIPGAGFIKAIMAIKDIIVFFVESAIALIPAITEAILALASGAKNRVAAAIENGLSLIIPIAIGLFARLIGLTGLVKKVQKIIKKIRKRISDQINKMIAKAKSWLRGKVKKGKAAVKKGVGKLVAWWKVKKGFKGEDGKKHTLLFKGQGKNAKMIVQSSPIEISHFINNAEIAINKLDEGKKKNKKKKSLEKAKGLRKKLSKYSSDIEKVKPEEKEVLFNKLRSTHTDLAKKLGEISLPNIKKAPPTVLPPFVDGVKAQSIKVKFLSEDTPKGDPSTKGDKHPEGWTEIKDSGIRKKENWVRMHLLHEKLGGKAADSNFVPAKSIVNQRFYQKLERTALTEIKNKKILWYKVDLAYHGTQPDFIKSISTQYGYHDPEKNWTEAKPEKVWNASVVAPSFDTNLNKLSINEEGITIMSKFRYEGRKLNIKFIRLLKEERNKSKETGKYKEYRDVTNVSDRLYHRHPDKRDLLRKNVSLLGIINQKGLLKF